MVNLDQILNTLKTDGAAQRSAMTGVGGLAAGLLLGRGGFDQVGLDFSGLGEHYRPAFVASAL